MLQHSRQLVLLTGALSLLSLSPVALSGIFCVDTAARFQTALTIAASNRFSDEIRLVQGAYVGNFTYDSREPFDLVIQGGFEPVCGQQSFDPAMTELDGALGGTVLSLSSRATGVSLSVKGLTIKNGRRVAGDGGGLYAKVANDSRVVLDTCIFDGNVADGRGGGAFVRAERGRAEIVNSVFVSNVAQDDGGGLAGRLDFGTAVIAETRILSNATTGDGGGMSVEAAFGTVEVKKNWIHGNSASDDGGGLYVETDAGISWVVDNVIDANLADDDGGGAYIDASSGSSSFVNNTVRGNTTGDDGAGLVASASEGNSGFLLSSNFFAENIADGDGGALDVEVQSGSVLFTNNTVRANFANRASGLRLTVADNEDQSFAVISNSLFWQNTTRSSRDSGKDLWIDNDADADLAPTPIIVQASNFDQTPNSGIFATIPFFIDPNNLDAVDPLFASPDTGSAALSATSPMLNAGLLDAPGLSERDLVGMPRVFGPGVDIGAVELVSPPIEVVMNCFFDWTQVAYAEHLAPPTSSTLYAAPFYFRHYTDTNTYLGVSDENWHVFFRGAGGGMSDLGSLNDWGLAAGCIDP